MLKIIITEPLLHFIVIAVLFFVAYDALNPETFDDQVMADFLMALANELCDNGTKRFGRCAADDCDRLFYDTSRNGSRRFCSDPRCASRTHTADHRKRKQDS